MIPARRLVLCLRPWTSPGDVGGSGTAVLPEGWLEHWTPSWEIAADGLYLDLTGMDRLLGSGCDGPVRICQAVRRFWGGVVGGAAPTSLAASLASRVAAAALAAGPRPGECAAPAGLLAVAAGSVATFLAPFGLEVLGERHPQAVRTLRRFGVRTLGDLQVVPRTLLMATLGGETGEQLAAEARGEAWRPLKGRRPEARTVVAARMQRPLTGVRAETALRRALAVRALVICPAGPGAWDSWELRVRWGEDVEQGARAPGVGDGTFAAWLELVEDLWCRLPTRRRGVMSVRLLAGSARPPQPVQGCLFREAAQAERLSAVWRRLRHDAVGPLFLASEVLLTGWGIRWDEGGPVVECEVAPGSGGQPQKRVGGGSRPRRRPAEGAVGKAASSRG
jgi:hypothetical protein